MDFYIDIEDSNGNRLGDGPITSAAGWKYTARMDRAGVFSFSLPANDPKASYIEKKRKVRAWVLLADVWTEIGAGIIDQIIRKPQTDGSVRLFISGDDELRDLTNRSVNYLKLASASTGLTHAQALIGLATYAPAGWTFNAAASPGNNFIYAEFAGESLLTAAVQVAEKTQTHFTRSGPKSLFEY